MDDARGGSQGRRLRAAGEGPVADPDLLATTIEQCVALSPGGIVARSLVTAVAERMGVAPAAISPRALSTALGLLIATGRVDEVAGRLVAVGQEHRRAG